MATSLVFDKGPATGQPVHLVFGDDGGSAGNTVPLALAATLPRLGAHITAGKRSALSVSASLPGPRVAVRLVFSHPATVAARLPGLGAHIGGQRVRPASLHGMLPGPGVHVSLVPVPGANVVATLPRLGAAVALGRVRTATFRARLPSLGVSIDLAYIVNTREPVTSGTRGRLQDAARLSVPLVSRLQRGTAMPSATRGTSTWGNPLASATTGSYQDATRQAQATQARQQHALPMPAAPLRSSYQDAIRTRISSQGRMQDGTPMHTGTRMRYQDADRTKRAWLRAAMQQGAPISALVASSMQHGVFFPMHMRGVEQDGRPPPPGRWPGRPIPPAFDPCYVPPHGLAVELLFDEAWSASAELVFICERHGPGPSLPQFVIPLLETYMTVHSIQAVLLPSLEPVILDAANLEADADSVGYGWSLSAAGPERLFDQLASVDGLPARVQITVDGFDWVFAIDPPSRTRRWGNRAVQITGRSVTSLLAAPHMPERSWANANVRTAQQLINEALEFTGVDLSWGIPDWLVPAGAWSHQGAPLSVALRVAEAVGAIVQSHRTSAQLQILPRYPSMPWEWDGLVPDVQMPLAVVESDSLQPSIRPNYNAVYVSGVAQGVLGHVRRAGTAGDILAPLVTDDLITHVDAARQRGRAVLGAGGTVVMQPLNVPLLTGGTLPGIFQINQLVELIEPSITWRGLVRKIGISVGAPTVRQTVVVERHL